MPPSLPQRTASREGALSPPLEAPRCQPAHREPGDSTCPLGTEALGPGEALRDYMLGPSCREGISKVPWVVPTRRAPCQQGIHCIASHPDLPSHMDVRRHSDLVPCSRRDRRGSSSAARPLLGHPNRFPQKCLAGMPGALPRRRKVPALQKARTWGSGLLGTLSIFSGTHRARLLTKAPRTSRVLGLGVLPQGPGPPGVLARAVIPCMSLKPRRLTDRQLRRYCCHLPKAQQRNSGCQWRVLCVIPCGYRCCGESGEPLCGLILRPQLLRRGPWLGGARRYHRRYKCATRDLLSCMIRHRRPSHCREPGRFRLYGRMSRSCNRVSSTLSLVFACGRGYPELWGEVQWLYQSWEEVQYCSQGWARGPTSASLRLPRTSAWLEQSPYRSPSGCLRDSRGGCCSRTSLTRSRGEPPLSLGYCR